MSRSNPVQKNPCKKFIEFKGDSGTFQYWDKEANEGKGENIPVNLPCVFVVLDQLSTIKGYHDADSSGIVSNEIHSLKQKLNVRSFGGSFKAVGEYNDIKDEIKAAGGKFTKSVYVCLKTDLGFELANFQFKGSSLGPWIEFCKKNNVEVGGVEITEQLLKEKKGKTEFYIPQFKARKISAETDAIAVSMDKQLQEYLKTYENQKIEEAVVKEEIEKPATDFNKIHSDNFGKSDVSDVKDMPWDDKTPAEDVF